MNMARLCKRSDKIWTQCPRGRCQWFFSTQALIPLCIECMWKFSTLPRNGCTTLMLICAVIKLIPFPQARTEPRLLRSGGLYFPFTRWLRCLKGMAFISDANSKWSFLMLLLNIQMSRMGLPHISSNHRTEMCRLAVQGRSLGLLSLVSPFCTELVILITM